LVRIQPGALGSLEALGRMRGYRGSYPEYGQARRNVTPDREILGIAGIAPPPAQ
jgi:hypothetical protein